MTTSTVTESEVDAVTGLLQQIVTAWQAHDAAAFAEVFTADGTMILPRHYQKGRDAIRTFMEQAYRGPFKGTRVTGTPFDVRLLAPGVAIVLTEGGILHGDEQEVHPDRSIRASWLAVKESGQWQLAAYQNSPRS
jgi:uncharacterized protein (TIGR02246 family)